MKYKNIFSLIFLLATLVACDDEKKLYPRSEDASSISRFEFPQGSNPWDQDLEEIANAFGTIPIYTAFDTLDLNQAWSGTFTIKYYGEPLSDEYAIFYTDFFKNHVFGFLKPELCKGVLPNYIYLVDDLRQVGAFTGGYVPLLCFWGGLDYWAFSFRAKEENLAYLDYGSIIIRPYKPYDLPKTPWEYKMRRTVILQNILAKMVEKGKIAIPADFQTGGVFDYSKKISISVNAENYYMKLGYPGRMLETAYDFTSLQTNVTMDAKTNFASYLKLGMRYTRDSVLIKYPEDKYPLIIRYYDFTVKYMKDKYDWDITRMAALKED
ncbi:MULTISPECIES: hypothetical protein [Butyricimonas]|uniref:hypothetical protein n=1 Tax=Butyricimonas TaxID=574697 RepID=UPI0007FB540E|nr:MULTISPECIES: hypothetical protein [Butyricimonas]